MLDNDESNAAAPLPSFLRFCSRADDAVEATTDGARCTLHTWSLAAFSGFTDLPEDDCPDTLITDLLASHVNGKL
jgi:hypothetical protein